MRKKQCAGDRWFRVEGHLHLGLGLTLGKIYAAADLKRQPCETAEICGGFFSRFFKKRLLAVLAKVIPKTDILKYRVFQFFTRISQIVIRRKCKGDQEKLKKLLDACQKPLEAWSTHQKGAGHKT